MIVVADTSPLNYLIQIDAGALLPQLYGRILITPGVLQAMCKRGAPSVVDQWAQNAPSWLDVCGPLFPSLRIIVAE